MKLSKNNTLNNATKRHTANNLRKAALLIGQGRTEEISFISNRVLLGPNTRELVVKLLREAARDLEHGGSL